MNCVMEIDTEVLEKGRDKRAQEILSGFQVYPLFMMFFYATFNHVYSVML